jgi:hypothetical protein
VVVIVDQVVVVHKWIVFDLPDCAVSAFIPVRK